MTIQYEDIYKTFSRMPLAERDSFISKVHRLRHSFTAPKKESKAAKKKESTKQTNKSKLLSIMDTLSPEEREEFLKHLSEE